MSEPIELDLRRDLPKVRAALSDLLTNEGPCRYTTPCAVGVMMAEEDRQRLTRQPGGSGGLNADMSKIRTLVERGLVNLPVDQISDASRLQSAFDNRGDRIEQLPIVLAELESKYLTQPKASGK